MGFLKTKSNAEYIADEIHGAGDTFFKSYYTEHLE